MRGDPYHGWLKLMKMLKITDDEKADGRKKLNKCLINLLLMFWNIFTVSRHVISLFDPEHAHLLLSPVMIQTMPDGADNLNGLLTAMLRNATKEPTYGHQGARVMPWTGTSWRS